MKKLIIGLMSALQVLSPAVYAADGALSSTDMQALQQRGRGLAIGAQSQTGVFDANGGLAKDANGKAAQTPASKQTITNQAGYFQNLTGIQSYQGTATPGRSDAAGAQVTASQGVNFSCATELGQRKNAGSQVIRLNSCSGPISGVQSLAVSVCSALAVGGVCDPKTHPESFTDYTVPVGDWASLPTGSIGASCNASGVCRVTIQATHSVGGTGTSLKSQAQAQVAANGDNSLTPKIQKIVESKTDAQRQTAIATRDCFLQNQDRMSKGLPALTCDGNQIVGATTPATDTTSSAAAAPASCNADQKTCLREATQTVNYSRSCTRTFPLTEYDCNWNVPTKSCTITVNTSSTAPATDSASTASAATSNTTSSCSDTDIAGAVKVGSTQGICDSTGNCNTATWVDTYVFPDKAAQVGSCTVYPNPLLGTPATSCANKGAGSIAGCADGGWVGRTLDDSQCYSSTSVKQSDGSVATSTTMLTYAEKAGCGYCAQPIYTDTCYAQGTANAPADSCGDIPAGCTLTSSTPESSVSGLTTSQTDTYTCSQQETSCVQYQTNPGCPTNLAMGTDHAPVSLSNMATFNQAMASAAVMTAIEKSARESGDITMPRIFTGNDLRCRRPVGYLSGMLLNDCCQIGLDHPGGNRPMHKCSDDEVKLAASRRANQTVYIGDYCSKEVGYWKFKKCVERTQTYCSFDGVLSRLIQTQGRDQLTQMVNSGFGTTQQSMLTFPYYKDQGGWGTPVVVNGVTVVPFQYPTYCTDAQKTSDALAANPDGFSCPNALTQWFATCDKSSCGDLPFAPELGSDTWLIQQVDPLKNHIESISRTATVDGACDPSTTQCSYKITAWPAASGGKAAITRDWAFNLYAPDGNAVQNLFSLGDYLFRPQSLTGAANGTAMPSSLTMQFSPDYGTTWSSISLPTRTTGSGVTIPNSDIIIAGSCDPAANTCSYKATGTVTATMKPWGDPHGPDCSGFTPSQISVMDFGKMDLSEWIAQVMGKVQPPDAGTLGKLASQQAQDFYNAMSTGGTQSSTGPARSRFATVSPTEAMGPFTARLYVSAYWPDASGQTDPNNPDKISSVLVDWGDCTLSTSADYASDIVNGKLVEAFTSSHPYVAPNQLICGAAEASVTHKVHLTITSKSGVHYTDLTVVNQWHNLTGQTVGIGESTGGANSTSLSAPLPGLQNPNQ